MMVLRNYSRAMFKVWIAMYNLLSGLADFMGVVNRILRKWQVTFGVIINFRMGIQQEI